MYGYLLAAVLAVLPPAAPDTVVVCPESLREALEPWLVYRTAQGHRISTLPSTLSASELDEAVKQLASGGQLRHLLLVGDVGSAGIPTHYTQARVNVHWGSEPEIATDNPYSDIDGDGIPDLSVGRLTADTPQELADMIAKIMRYEQSESWGDWKRRINLIAGVGGFGPFVDSVIETAAEQLLTEGIPPAYQISMTYGSWRSPYCPDPRRFRDVTLERLNEGCLFWIYIGHGQARALDLIRVPGGAYPSITTDDAPQMRSTEGNPIALMMACYTGAFDFPNDCLAEAMLRSPGGPVAVVSGSRVTMPYAMAIMGSEMMQAYFNDRPETLGELLLQVKQRTAAASRGKGSSQRRILDLLGQMLSPSPDLLMQERLEHLQLFNLLGDPLLRLTYPKAVQLDTPEVVQAGQRVKISLQGNEPGRYVVELVTRRDQHKRSLPPRQDFRPDELADFDQAYQLANDRLWASTTLVLSDDAFECDLEVPAEASGPCHVRVYTDRGGSYAIGARDVMVEAVRKED